MTVSFSKKVLLLFWIAMFQGGSFLELRITPQKAHIPSNSRYAKIMCQASEPITACQFNYMPNKYDLSNGSGTPPDVDYQYYGTGLEQGQCGIILKKNLKSFNKSDLVGCRVRNAATKGWVYAQMTLIKEKIRATDFSFDRKSAVVLPGSNISLLCRANEALANCSFWQPNKWSYSGNRVPGFQDYGAGLEKGQCGVTILNVTGEMNGVVGCTALTRTEKLGHGSDIMDLIVAKPPSKPDLLLSTTDFVEGATLVATCYAKSSRPVSTLTWLADDTVLRDDPRNEYVPEIRWRWTYDLWSMKQVLKWKLSWEDNGKRLKCQAKHVALETGKMDSEIKRINVKYSPRNISQPIIVKHLRPGKKGEIHVKVSANPKPTITWTIGNKSFVKGKSDLKEVDAFTWRAVLIIDKVDKLEMAQDVFLTARNAIGKNAYRIRVVFK